MRRTLLMVWKEFAHIRGDKLTIRLMIFPGLMQLFVLGYALTTEVRNTPLAAVDLSGSPQSRSLIASVRASGLFRFVGQRGSTAEVKGLLDNGTARLALVIPPDFARDLPTSRGASVQVLVDGQDANSATVAAGYLRSVVSQWSMEQLSGRLSKQGIEITRMLPVTVSPVILFNPLLQSTWFMIPALVVLLVTIVTALLTGFSIVREKESGTLEQLMVTPVEPTDVIIGKTVPYLLVGIVELCAFLVLATLWFRIPFRGNFLTFLLFGILYMISSLGIGILTSTIARTPQQVLFLIWFVLIFFILLSGFFIPVENMPGWVQVITLINPVKHFMAAVRELFLKGATLSELWREAVWMIAIGVTVLGSSVLLFHRRAK